MLSIKDFKRPDEGELNQQQQIFIGGNYTTDAAYPMVVYYEVCSTHLLADFIAFDYRLMYDEDADCDLHDCRIKPYAGNLFPDYPALRDGISDCIHEVCYFIAAYLNGSRRDHVGGDATMDCTRWCIVLDGEERISTYTNFSVTI